MSDSAIGTSKAANSNAFAGIKVVIEFASKQCEQIVCNVTKSVYRGRWDPAAMRGRLPDDRFANMPEIPGIRILFDGGNRRVMVHDPLRDPENAQTLRAAQEVMKQMGWGKADPVKDRNHENLTDELLKNWLYWIRRWIDAGQARPENGTVAPAMETILDLPGRVKHLLHDSSPVVDRYKEPDRPYISPAGAIAGQRQG